MSNVTLQISFAAVHLHSVFFVNNNRCANSRRAPGISFGTKLIIVHADDLGETHAVNAAAIKTLESGSVNSASMMVPCPWFPEIADYAKSHPAADFGLHLTVTSERVYYRWGPVAACR